MRESLQLKGPQKSRNCDSLLVVCHSELLQPYEREQKVSAIDADIMDDLKRADFDLTNKTSYSQSLTYNLMQQ